MKKVLLFLSLKFNGNWDEIYEFLQNKEKINNDELSSYLKEFDEKYITMLDDDYPECLKHIEKPPFVLFYRGKIDLLNSTRIIWPKSSLPLKNNSIYNIMNFLSRNNLVPVISYENEESKKLFYSFSKIPSITVCEYGDKRNLIESKEFIKYKESLIISDYPFNDPRRIKANKPFKKGYVNRMKIGISKGVLILNSKWDKNLFLTLLRILEYNKKVYCLSDNSLEEEIKNNNLNKELIKNGAIEIKNLNKKFKI